MEKRPSAFHTPDFLRQTRDFLVHIFNLEEGRAREEDTIEEIKKGVVFRGTNLWILICAIFIASIGLNVNSTAVIIGAMLISPLMGPIIGIGLGIGIFDVALIRKAVKNLAIAGIISVMTSTIYFLITPLSDAQTEILARTTPTLWDVLIALFGGFAGIIAGSRLEKSNAIPGVAIATALMPPLCTAGYGLATAQWNFFFGAIYLFFINCVFITVATILIVRYLKFTPVHYVDDRTEHRVRVSVGFLVIATMLPSIFIAYNVVQKSLFERKARTFIDQEMNYSSTQIINQQLLFRPDTSRIIVTCIGQTIDSARIRTLASRLPTYGLPRTQLIIRQDYNELNANKLQELNQQLRTGILEDLYTKNEEIIQDKDARIERLEKELARYRSLNTQSSDIGREMKVEHPTVTEFSLSFSPVYDLTTMKPDTVSLAYVRFSRQPSRAEVRRLEAWLKVRTKTEKLRLVMQ
ncbi:TIGR00341 family protein [Rhabdobacter roseus]|uniref:Putative hydrophobic protein (TIGR00271 family) n=1 Tax=Rhabdobacter roseus TaxID=1655419 RepID=A0A840U1A6_9BACT|nr:TIGR00341 family protein [Rhabdobacter roseus]MBB5285649.1 putative hydrophobic protein (TIGR00271 family) [Rhabdobacter roseus]